MAANKLTEQEIQQELRLVNEVLPAQQQWRVVAGKLVKQFVFKDFVQAFGWMTQVAMHAENMNHHPEWSNVWNKVDVALVTHDVDGLSELDFKMIKRMEQLISG